MRKLFKILKQHSPDGKFPTMKRPPGRKKSSLRFRRTLNTILTIISRIITKNSQTVCANVDSILGAEQEVQQHAQQHTRKYEPSL